MMLAPTVDALIPVPVRTADDRRWTAVLARDRDADGSFVYAVTSTGVFCRPSCPSRRPGRERVRFFDTALSAERAGFRACRRCAPAGARPPPSAPTAVTRAAAHLRPHAPHTVSLADIPAHAGARGAHRR